MSDKFEIDRFHAGEALINVLYESKLISESFYRINKASIEILTENSSVDAVSYHGQMVSREDFKRIYLDPNYRDISQVFNALGFQSDAEDASLKRALGRMIININSGRKPDDLAFPSWGDRDKYIKNLREMDRRAEEGDDPDLGDIEGGYRGRRNQTTRTVDKLNNAELVQGEFYSDISRIPKRNWQHWLRFWRREATETGLDVKGFKVWKKAFVLGYQLTKGTFVEIWYNSIDSTFTVHDHNGVNVGRHRSPALNESIKRMFNFIAANVDQTDADFFSLRNPLSQSAVRSVSMNIDKDIINDFQNKADEEEKLRVMSSKERELYFKKIELEAERGAMKAERDVVKTELNIEKEKESLTKEREAIDKERKEIKARQKSAFKTTVQGIKKGSIQGAKFVEAVRVGVLKAYDKFQIDSMGVSVDDIVAAGWEVFDEGITEPTNAVLARIFKMAKDAAYKKGNVKKKQPSKAEYDELKAERDIFNPKKRKSLDLGYDIPSMVRTSMHESFGTEFPEREVTMDVDLQSRGYDSVVKNVRQQAGVTTLAAIRNTVMADQIRIYEVTKAPVHKNIFFLSIGQAIQRLLNRSELPNSEPFWSRWKNAVLGRFHRADFVIGFTLNNAINIEIWYITEPNPNHKSGDEYQVESIASFYVYDVTGESVVGKYLPYFRNALQTVLKKIGTYGD